MHTLYSKHKPFCRPLFNCVFVNIIPSKLNWCLLYKFENKGSVRPNQDCHRQSTQSNSQKASQANSRKLAHIKTHATAALQPNQRHLCCRQNRLTWLTKLGIKALGPGDALEPVKSRTGVISAEWSESKDKQSSELFFCSSTKMCSQALPGTSEKSAQEN